MRSFGAKERHASVDAHECCAPTDAQVAVGMGCGSTVSELPGEGLMATHVRWLMRAGLVAVLVLAACTTKPSAPVSPAPSPSLRAPSSPPADPRLAAVQDALGAYRSMWLAF